MRKILLVGFGNMGQALVSGWLERGIGTDAIHVTDPRPEALAEAGKLGLGCSAAVADAAAEPFDVIVLAVKPAQVDDALGACVPLRGAPLLLSIAAGRTLASLTAIAGADAAIVRAMPNTPAAIGKGMTVMTGSAQVAAQQRGIATDLMAAVGEVEWVDDERFMDAVTAVSGSGPAYVFLLIEALAEAGVGAGLERGLATRLATETVAGAGAYARGADIDAAELRRRVTSPGGTTEAALRVLMSKEGLAPLLERAVRAAAERSRELSTG